MFLFFVACALAQAPQCGTTCRTFFECLGNDTCSHCDLATDTCQKGLPCGSNCTVDRDCNLQGSCKYCNGGMCKSDGLCGSYCDATQKCLGICKNCTNNICQSDCGVGCRSMSTYPLTAAA